MGKLKVTILSLSLVTVMSGAAVAPALGAIANYFSNTDPLNKIDYHLACAVYHFYVAAFQFAIEQAFIKNNCHQWPVSLYRRWLRGRLCKQYLFALSIQKYFGNRRRTDYALVHRVDRLLF